MNPRSAECEAEVDERGINDGACFSQVKEVVDVAEVTEAAPDAVARAVLVQHEDLSWTEPTVRAVWVLDPKGKGACLQETQQLVVVEVARISGDELIHPVLPRAIRVTLDPRDG